MRPGILALSLAFSPLALAGGSPRFTQVYGQTYAEVGNPGNADYTYKTVPGGSNTRSVGGVDYRYRIAVTEVTNSQWAEFANAITPHLDSIGGWGSDFAPSLTFDFAGGLPVFSPRSGEETYPARMGWRWAARYCNWLHNGKALAAEAFESGAYDTSTFGTEIGEYGFTEYTDQSTRSDGARFWIPSEDEWVKAAYYDPNKNGEGHGGYWLFHGMRDDPLVTAPPEQGGETNAGGFDYSGPGEIPFDVGSYTDIASHYGVLDSSGGEWEWSETWTSDLFERARYALGSANHIPAKYVEEMDMLGIDLLSHGAPDGSVVGLRLAMVVPTPGIVSPGAVGLILCTAFKRRRSHGQEK